MLQPPPGNLLLAGYAEDSLAVGERAGIALGSAGGTAPMEVYLGVAHERPGALVDKKLAIKPWGAPSAATRTATWGPKTFDLHRGSRVRSSRA